MSEEQNDQPQNDQPQDGKPAEFTPITSQEDFDRALAKRLERERSKFADYDSLREKASKLAAIEEAGKTEAQKAADRIKAAEERAAAAERRAAEFEQTALKTRIAAEMGVIPEVVNGTDEESMRASAQRVLDWAAQGKRPVPKPSSLASGSAAPKGGEQGRAAAALRALRQG